MNENFTKHPVELMEGQTVAHCEEIPTELAESYISHAELFRIVKQDNKYRNKEFNPKGVNLINKHL